MAKAKTPVESIAIGARQAASEARKTFRELNAQREQSKNLLSPDDVSGEYDAARLLFTTLGGELRPLTYDDLKQFQYKVRLAKDKYKKGIKPKDVINFSLPDDRERANQEIRAAVPLSTKAGELKFTTNAGPNSKKTRHYVTVRMLNFEAAVVSPIEPAKIVNQVIKGPVAFTCDCERWRYWYAYIATVGGYNAGYREAAFPKIRNPDIQGIACKHILRVMAQMEQSPTLKGFVASLIDREREAVERKRKAVQQRDMKQLEQSFRRESSRQRQIKTTEEKRQARNSTPSAIARAAARAKEKSVKAAAAEAAKRGIDAQIAATERLLRSTPGLPESAIQAALQAARKDLAKIAKVKV